MRFEKCFQTASLALICSGFMSILLAGTINVITAVCFLAILFTGWFRKPKKVKKLYQWLITGLILLIFLTDLLLVSRLAIAVIRLMLMLILLKVFTREERRDYSTLYLLSFSLLLISSTSTISALFVLSAAAVLFTFVLSLVLFEMRPAYQENPAMEFSLRKSLHATGLITVLIIVLAIPIFLVIPRTALGMFGQTQISSIGFSPSVNLGDMGPMLENGEVVMRIEVRQGRDAVTPDLKWRGVAMDRFNGRTWVNTFSGSKQIVPDLQGRYLLETGRFQDEHLIEQSVYMEPFSNVVFTSHNPIQLSGFSRSAQVMQAGNQAIYLQPKPNQPVEYTLYTDIQSRTRRIRAFDPERPLPQIDPRYLQLPEIDSRIQPLAQTIVKDATSRLAEVLLLENFLKSQFEYSLNHNSGNSEDPLGNFLFSTRTGHCEYFANAHVIMLRSLGIPARMINGFRAGEYNEWGDYFIVRQSDAHSWVEAWLPGSGWIEFDPTPPVQGNRSFSLARTIGKILDNLDILWTEIVTFDRYKQFGFFRMVVRNAMEKWDEASRSARNLADINLAALLKARLSLEKLVTAGIAGIFALLAGLLLWANRISLVRVLKRFIFRLEPEEMVREYYRDMLRIFKSKGDGKHPSETPREFLSRIQGFYPAAYPGMITDIYLRTRFGGQKATSGDLEKLSEALRKLRKLEKLENQGAN